MEATLLVVLAASSLAAAGAVQFGAQQQAAAVKVHQHAAAAALASLLAGSLLIAIGMVLDQVDRRVPVGLLSALIIAASVPGALAGLRNSNRGLRSRRSFEAIAHAVFAGCAAVAIVTTIGIVFSMLAETVRFFERVSIGEFLFGLEWSPQIAIRADQAGASGKFGVIPLLAGTMLISAIAMIIATPLGIVVAIYLSEFANPNLRRRLKPALEYLAGIPTVVYGFFAVVVLNPWLRDIGGASGFEISSETALASGLMIAALILPFIISLSDDAMFVVPDDLRAGSFGMGATRYETAMQIVVPAAMPGIVSSILLALSRAVGETMIVVMAAGLAANLTVNPLESVTTVTVQIVALLTGDQEFDDPKTLAAFGLGLLLFMITLLLNFIALQAIRKYQERYE
ncbi:MAG: phosphate ABC transporter permease subunit PstC [Betaproteobacteria bacterium]|nr:phosphate ABC transporter permease subunit PstC [Betaproteobacteria bacterium]